MLITLGHHLLWASQRRPLQVATDSKTKDSLQTGWRHKLVKALPVTSWDKKSVQGLSPHPAGEWVAWMGDVSTDSPPLFGILGASFERWCDTQDTPQRERILGHARDALMAAFAPILQSAPQETERMPTGVEGVAVCNARQTIDRFMRLDVDWDQRTAFLCALNAKVARDAPGLDAIRAWAKVWAYLEFHPKSDAAAEAMTWVRANLDSASVRKRWVQTRVEVHLVPDLARIAADYESPGDADKPGHDFDGGAWLDRLDLKGAVVPVAPSGRTPDDLVRAGAQFVWKGKAFAAIVLDWTPDDAGCCPVRLHQEEAAFKVLLDLPRETDERGTVFRVPRSCLVPYSVG